MRFSTSAVLAAVAIGVQALPQEYSAVQPITQISDGQIQAPPATAPVSSGYAVPTPSAPAASEVPSVTPVPLPSEVPSVTPVPLPSVVPSSAAPVPVPSSGYETPVVPVPSVPAPSVPAGTGSAPPYPIPSSAPVYGNSTVPAPTGGSTHTSAEAPSSATSGASEQPTEAPGSAAANAISFAAVFAGLVAFLA
ncbi:hypothetical protein BU23DRAFT_552702 [Bimuria novae-zelandiae CBS 107.79]|uniref:Uncharacterized protein n=1 Tax=Bimuria novae-zelandiae CBS 107.79 TaxID=1447943 RepID=A0A6A5VF23_9PLEO|nr:hypothetical protein BU23DRAFT_552702 [Bimuria novae-zelandiae CBS 107.79]